MLPRPPLHATFVAGLMLASASALVHCSSEDGASPAGQADGGGGDGTASSTSSSGGGGSSSSSSGGPGDGGGDANQGPRCDPSKPFGEPMMVLEGSFRIDQSARLSPDELTLTYASYGHDGVNGQTELFVATRASTSVPFENPTKIAELSTSESESFPTVTADGLTIYYQGKLDDAGYGTLRATRPSTTSPWGAPTMLAGLDLSMIYVAPDGTRLYGVKDLPGGPPYNADLHYVDLPYDGGASQVIPGTASGGLQYWPVMSADGLTLFYSYPMLNPYRWELGVAKRATTSDPFGPVTKVAELDTVAGADENADWVSPDGCTLYIRRVNATIDGNASGLLQATRGL